MRLCCPYAVSKGPHADAADRAARPRPSGPGPRPGRAQCGRRAEHRGRRTPGAAAGPRRAPGRRSTDGWRPPAARRHGDRPRGRGPRRRRCAAFCPQTRSPTSRRGRPCRTNGSRPGRTPSAGGSPCCAGWRTPIPPTRRPVRSRSSSPRSAAVLQPLVPGLGDLEPVGLREPATRPTSTTSSTPLAAAATPASTWSSGAASSRSAAASSTSSRPPRSTRCGWSSGATPSRRSAGSRSPTSAASRSPARAVGAAVPRAAAHRRGPRRAPRPSPPQHPERRRHARQARRGHRRRGHGVPRPGRSSTTSSCWSTSCPAGAHVAGLRPRAGPHPGPRPGRHQRGVPRRRPGPAAAGGGKAPVDLGAAAFRTLAEVREHAARARRPVVDASRPFARRTRRPSSRRVDALVSASARPPSPTAATPSGRSPTSRPGCRTAGGSLLVTEGHGPAQRARRACSRDARRRRAARGRPARDAERRRRAVTTGSSTTASCHDGSGSPSSPRPTSTGAARHDDQGHAADAVAAAQRVDPLQLKPGDYVVHEQHGVGRYVEMVQRTVAGRHPRVPRHRVRRVASAASPATGCSCPTDSLDQVTRYVGGEAPTLTSWAAPTGPRPRAAPARRSRRSPPS